MQLNNHYLKETPLGITFEVAVVAAIGVDTLVKIYLIKSKLPSGVCTVANNRPMMYVAMVITMVSTLNSLKIIQRSIESNCKK